MEVDDERHRADVRCPSGLVVEFQNSHISPDDIEARENFYGRMLWIVNGAGFNDRFQISSTFEDERMFLETERKTQLNHIKFKRQEQEEVVKKALKQAQVRIDGLAYTRQRDLQRIEELNQPQMKASTVLAEILDRGTKLKGLRYEVTSVDESTPEEEERFKTLLYERLALHNDVEAFEARVKSLAQAQRYGDTNFIQVEYNKRYQHHWESMRWLPLKGGALLKKFQSRTDFLAHKYKTSVNALFFDPTLEQARLQEAASIARAKAVALMTSIESIVTGWVASRTERLTSELALLNEKYRSDGPFELKLSSAQAAVKAQQETLDDLERTTDIEELDVEWAMDAREELIDSVFVDVLRYRWKHKRAVWNFSDAPMFFDFGDDYLYRRLDQDFVHRICKDEFLEHLLKTQEVPQCPEERPSRMTYAQSRGF